jgi:hypothetical protein
MSTSVAIVTARTRASVIDSSFDINYDGYDVYESMMIIIYDQKGVGHEGC